MSIKALLSSCINMLILLGCCKQGACPQSGPLMQAASNGLADAELDVQTDYQSYSFVPVNEAQVLQLVIFILMFFGAMAFYLWFLKPLFRLLDRVSLGSVSQLNQLVLPCCEHCLALCSVVCQCAEQRNECNNISGCSLKHGIPEHVAS